MIDFTQSADIVAPQLLGGMLTHAGVTIRITEVEAYLGGNDKAAHTARGKTPSNAAMFGPPAHMYIYASYGIHRAGNIVCAPEGDGQGCLIRAGEVINGLALALDRRGNVPFERLAQGPGNVGKALDLHRYQNGESIFGPEFHFEERTEEPYWTSGPRIGISKNTDAALRFWIPGDKTVTSPRGRVPKPPKK